MDSLKDKFISAIRENPSLLQYKWAELERRFKIPATGRPGDRARKWWRAYEKSLETAFVFSGPAFEPAVTGVPVDEPTPNGLKVKSVWEVQGKNGEVKVLKSYTAESIATQEFRETLIKDLQEFSPKVELKHDTSSREGHMLEIAIPDFHIGRIGIEQAREQFLAALQHLLTEAVYRYNVTRIVFPVGNDWLNTDNLDYATTRGTKQFDVSPWYETFRYGWRILVEAINLASEIAPVDVIVVQGNHDKSKMFYIGDVLMAYFANDFNVSVDNSFNPFKFYRFGNSLIMYEHGELKPSDYPLILADERKKDWAETKFREVHLGHFHKEMTLDEYRGVKVRFLPSLSSESLWEKEKGYNHTKQAQALLWSPENGLRTTFYYSV